MLLWSFRIDFFEGGLFSKGIFFKGGGLFLKVAESNSYSGELKPILMIYMVQVYKKMFL